MPRLPDLVRDSRLNTEFRSGLTIHSYTVSDSTSYKRSVIKHVRWQKGGKIGAGGVGSVHVERRVGKTKSSKPELRAVKRIRDATHTDYLHELEAIAKFSHASYERCFVKSYGWYEEEDSLCIAMEYLELGDLQQSISDLPALPEDDAAIITSQLLEGLHFMHDNDFAHWDMKPKNVLVMWRPPHYPSWWVKIADFGISKRLEEEGNTTTVLQGTLNFIAPELLFRKQKPLKDRIPRDYFAADIWAVGCTTYFMLTNSVPFQDWSQFAAHYEGKVQSPALDIPAEICGDAARAFVLNLLHISPAARPTAEEGLVHDWIRDVQQDSLGEEADTGRWSDSDHEEGLQASLETSKTSLATVEAGTATTHTEQASARWTTVLQPAIMQSDGALTKSNELSQILNRQDLVDPSPRLALTGGAGTDPREDLHDTVALYEELPGNPQVVSGDRPELNATINITRSRKIYPRTSEIPLDSSGSSASQPSHDPYAKRLSPDEVDQSFKMGTHNDIRGSTSEELPRPAIPKRRMSFKEAAAPIYHQFESINSERMERDHQSYAGPLPVVGAQNLMVESEPSQSRENIDRDVLSVLAQLQRDHHLSASGREFEDQFGHRLPPGWERRENYMGKPYYVDHNARQTTWISPVRSSASYQSGMIEAQTNTERTRYQNRVLTGDHDIDLHSNRSKTPPGKGNAVLDPRGSSVREGPRVVGRIPEEQVRLESVLRLESMGLDRSSAEFWLAEEDWDLGKALDRIQRLASNPSQKKIIADGVLPPAQELASIFGGPAQQPRSSHERSSPRNDQSIGPPGLRWKFLNNTKIGRKVASAFEKIVDDHDPSDH